MVFLVVNRPQRKESESESRTRRGERRRKEEEEAEVCDEFSYTLRSMHVERQEPIFKLV